MAGARHKVEVGEGMIGARTATAIEAVVAVVVTGSSRDFLASEAVADEEEEEEEEAGMAGEVEAAIGTNKEAGEGGRRAGTRPRQ